MSSEEKGWGPALHRRSWRIGPRPKCLGYKTKTLAKLCARRDCSLLVLENDSSPPLDDCSLAPASFPDLESLRRRLENKRCLRDCFLLLAFTSDASVGLNDISEDLDLRLKGKRDTERLERTESRSERSCCQFSRGYCTHGGHI